MKLIKEIITELCKFVITILLTIVLLFLYNKIPTLFLIIGFINMIILIKIFLFKDIKIVVDYHLDKLNILSDNLVINVKGEETKTPWVWLEKIVKELQRKFNLAEFRQIKRIDFLYRKFLRYLFFIFAILYLHQYMKPIVSITVIMVMLGNTNHFNSIIVSQSLVMTSQVFFVAYQLSGITFISRLVISCIFFSFISFIPNF